jgi:pimeloyl-ACP methyl ester carboxylesterase
MAAVWEEGPEVGMAKIPLVLLPGLMCDHTVWEPQIAALADLADCTVLDWDALDSLVDMADLVLRTAPERFAMAGHSMGGRVAFEVYRKAGERVTHIALFNTNYVPLPRGEAGDNEARGRYEMLALAREKGMRVMSKKWLEGMIPSYRQQDSALVENIVQMFERKSPDLFEKQMRALLNRPDASAVLAQIRCPALVLTGTDDAWSPPQRHEEMAAAIPGSRLVLVEKCGHMSTLERPEEVSRAMREWLTTAARQEPSSPR